MLLKIKVTKLGIFRCFMATVAIVISFLCSKRMLVKKNGMATAAARPSRTRILFSLWAGASLDVMGLFLLQRILIFAAQRLFNLKLLV